MRLAYWNSVWLDGEFFPQTGKVVTRVFVKTKRDENAYPGYFSNERAIFGLRTTFAVYLESEGLYFQANSRRWSLNQPGLEFRFKVFPLGILSRFEVVESGRTTFAISYLHLVRSISAILDPTYDLLEFENDHFLSWVASTALLPKWQSDIRQFWAHVEQAV